MEISLNSFADSTLRPLQCLHRVGCGYRPMQTPPCACSPRPLSRALNISPHLRATKQLQAEHLDINCPTSLGASTLRSTVFHVLRVLAKYDRNFLSSKQAHNLALCHLQLTLLRSVFILVSIHPFLSILHISVSSYSLSRHFWPSIAIATSATQPQPS